LRVPSIQPQHSTTSIASVGVIDFSRIHFVNPDPYLIGLVVIVGQPAIEAIRIRKSADPGRIDLDRRHDQPTPARLPDAASNGPRQQLTIAPPIGTARMLTHGSCRPLVTTSTLLPSRSMDWRGVRIDEVGFTAKRATTG
jgi:hypothetical protein